MQLGIDESRLDVRAWCDLVWSLLAEFPSEAVDQLVEQLIPAEARADPRGARKTWGLLPEHQAAAANLEASNAPGARPGGKDAEPEVPDAVADQLRGGGVAPRGA